MVARQHGGGIAAGMAGMTVGAVPGPSQQPTFDYQPELSSTSLVTTSCVPGLPPRRVTSISTRPKQRDRAVAVWNYDSQSYGDLAFKKDEVIIVDEDGESAPGNCDG